MWVNKKDLYGATYNFYAASIGKLAPFGWHVPTQTDINNLITYLGGYSVAGSFLKETGYSHWYSPNTGAVNNSGFTALPGGYRSIETGDFINIGTRAVLWSSSESNGLGGRFIIENTSINTDFSYYTKVFGFNVRCIKD